MNVSYYRIDYRDAINSPLGGSDSQAFFREFPDLLTIRPDSVEIARLANEVTGGMAALEATILQGRPIESINRDGGPRILVSYDVRARNLGLFRLGGIDFNLYYTRPTSFGSIDASFAGNYQTVRTNQVSPIAPQVDLLRLDEPTLRFMASLGANIGQFRAQATLYHTHGYDTARSTTRMQDRVGAFNVVNLFFKYDFDGDNLTRDLSLTLNVNNVFNTDPPLLRDGGARQNGFTNGQTLGRLVQFGINKRF